MTLQVTVLTGATGSGKTELALNLSRRYRDSMAAEKPVSLVDLDLITPFFRSREHQRLLQSWGVELIHPRAHGGADLPLMPPRLFELLRRPAGAVILDVGGGEEGTRVLGGLVDYFEQLDYQHLAVVNPRRPQTESVEAIVKTVRDIERISRLPLTGLVSNPNLAAATTVEQICRDHHRVIDAAVTLRLPVRWLCVYRPMLDDLLDVSLRQRPVTELFPIDRWLLPDWERYDGGDTS